MTEIQYKFPFRYENNHYTCIVSPDIINVTVLIVSPDIINVTVLIVFCRFDQI